MIMRGCVLLEKSIHHRRRHRDTLGVVYIIIHGKVMSFDVYILYYIQTVDNGRSGGGSRWRKHWPLYSLATGMLLLLLL